MLKKTIEYEDYNGTTRKEDFYFNLSKAELLEMELGTTGGLSEMIGRMVSALDAPSIIAQFKGIIMKAYGEKSADGKRFVKSEELSIAFTQTEAYSKLFTDLLLGGDEGIAEFIQGIIPAEMASELANKRTGDVPANN